MEGAGGVDVDLNSSPAKDIVDSLVGMGIAKSVAEMAVRQTGADGAEAAIAWVFENGGQEGMGEGGEGEEEDAYPEYKMVFVVNTSLPMTPGKMAAQVGHATLDLYRELVRKQDLFGGPLLQWDENGSRKIVLQGKDADELKALSQAAEQEGLPCVIIQDAGHTQIPAGSRTVMAVFGAVEDVDKVTGKLKLMP